jgi:hypothetical protein
VNSVAVSSISSFRGTDVESWITSDGRAYLVQLVESSESDNAASHWEKTQTDESVRFLRQYRSRGGVHAQLVPRVWQVDPGIQDSAMTVQIPVLTPNGRARAYMTCMYPNGCRSGSKSILTRERAKTIMNSRVELSKLLSI